MKEMDGEEQNFICNFIPNESNGAKSFVNKIKTQNSISINFDLTISGGHIDDVIAQSFPDLEIVGDTTAKPQIGQLSYTSEWKDLCLCGEIPGGYIIWELDKVNSIIQLLLDINAGVMTASFYIEKIGTIELKIENCLDPAED